MKRTPNRDLNVSVLERRIINEEYLKAQIEKQQKLENIREYYTMSSYKNGGIL